MNHCLLNHICASFIAAILLSTTLCAQTEYGASAPIQNAILEGVNLQTDDGATPDERLVTCYFIFNGKPASYFYNMLAKEKKLTFEFNDAEMGTAPIASAETNPITGFEIEKKRVNANADIKGLNPEWHDVVVVKFALNAIPKITAHDEYSIVSFSYKWTTDPSKIALYTEQPKKPIALYVALGAVGVSGVGVLVGVLTKPPPPPADGPLLINDLPSHQN